MQESSKKPSPHTLTLTDRQSLTLTGVVDVPGFDEETIHIKLDSGTLVVKGASLHINKLSLDSGDVCIDGVVNSLQYLSSPSGKSVRSRIFR